MDKRTLEAQASACGVLFNRLKTILSEDASQERAGLLTALDDQHGRFNIWAGNIGVFAAGHASLDYRLREELQPKSLVGGLLDGLQDHLQRATYTHQRSLGVNEDDENTEEDSAYVCDNASISSRSLSSAAPESYYSASGSDIGTESDTKSENLSPFEERLRSVEQVVDRLFRFTTAIRKPSQAAQNFKADLRVIKDEEGGNDIRSFELFARSFVKHRFPDADAALLERMSKAMLLRRRRFIFRRRHQRKLDSKGLVPVVSKSIPSWGASQFSRTTLVATPQVASSSNTKQPGKPRDDALSCTEASKFHRAKFRADFVLAPSTKAPSTVFAGSHADTVPVPPPPKLLPSSKEFECPYCCMILPVEESTPTRWRLHVLQDLECYVCVFDNCSQANHLFSDRASWLSHMEWEHSRQWHCTLHGSVPDAFETEAHFVDHMKLDHPGAFSDLQISTLKHMNARPSQVVFSSCPLCGLEAPEDLVDGLESPHDSNYTLRLRKRKAISNFVANHLAAHLQEVAVRSLPWSEDVEDDASSVRTASRNGRGSTIDRDDDQSPLDFDDRGPNLTPSEEEVIVTTPQDENKSLEWDFIPKLEYAGHDNDKRLQAFVQAFYMSDANVEKPEVRFPCHMMPFGRNRSFFGRKKELTDIEGVLCPSTAAESAEEYALLKTFAITGPGGMGKSQLATEFVCQNKGLFDAVFWVHADEQSKLAQDFSRVALALGLVGPDSPEAKDHVLTRERVKMWLANPLKSPSRSSKRGSNDEGPLASWLMVYDGADRPEILNVFWPLGGSGSILITSRDPLPWTASLDLKPFTPEDGAGFLLKTTRRGASKEDEEHAIIISRRLGGLPLALTQMARFITNSNLTFSEFIDAYSEREKKEAMFKFQVHGPNAQASYGHNLASVWALENLKEGKALLDVISMLDPDSIPEHILTSYAETVTLKDYPTSIKAYSAARTELIQSSIVGGNARTQNLFIHRLVQDVARLRMSQSQYRNTFDAAVRLISSVWPYQPFTWRHSISRWPQCAELYPHIIRLKELAKPFAPDVDNVAGDFEYARLLMDAGWYQHERGGSSEAMGFYDTAQFICESIKYLLPKLGPKAEDSVPLYECQALALQVSTSGNNTPPTPSPTSPPSKTPHSVAFAEPIARSESDVPLCEQIFFAERTPTTAASGTRSSSEPPRYRSPSLTTPPDQALAPRAGGNCTVSEKEVDAVLAELHHNRGCIATETNCPKDALRYHGQFSAMMLKEFENRPPGLDWRLGISWNQLGTAKMINEFWEEGEDCFRRAILAMHKVDNFKQVWVSLPVVNLGQAYWLTNRCEKALIVLMEGLSYRQAHFGLDDKESFITGRFFHAIGNVKATQGHMEESLEYHRKALLHYKNTLGNNHHRTADTCIKVADHCIRKDQLGTALTLLDQALRAYGDREAYRPEKARAMFKRAKVLRLLGRKDEAEEELEASGKLYQEIRPKDTRRVEDLKDEDFDKTVVFWSR